MSIVISASSVKAEVLITGAVPPTDVFDPSAIVISVLNILVPF